MKEVASLLRQDPNVVFAYAHGSFLKAEHFGDLDVAVYLSSDITSRREIETSLSLTAHLSRELQLPVDVRPLNSATLGFCYDAIQGGRLLTSSNEPLRVEYVKQILFQYFDFRPVLKRSVRQLLAKKKR